MLVKPKIPSVLKTCKNMLLELKNLHVQRFSDKFKKAGRKIVKALKKLSGPKPKKGFILKLSTAIFHPAAKGRSWIGASPLGRLCAPTRTKLRSWKADNRKAITLKSASFVRRAKITVKGKDTKSSDRSVSDDPAGVKLLLPNRKISPSCSVAPRY